MKTHLFIFLLLSLSVCHAQTDSLIHINGRVYDPESKNPDLSMFMVVNLRTQNGVFGKADGTFSTDMHRTDSLVVAVTGYEFVKYCYKDSSRADTFNLTVRLKKKEVRLPEVRIIAPRDIEAIQRDIQKLGYNKKDYELSGISIMESPVTFLYEEFSRREILRRHNAVIVNDEKKRNLLRELLAHYVADSIINLTDKDFDHFIDFCNVSEDFLKTSTQYDFMVYIKHRYEMFEDMKDYYRPDHYRQQRENKY